jgi:glycerol kinase
MKVGLYPDMEGFAKGWALERRFEPGMPEAARNARYAAWKRAVQATLSA